MKIENVKIINYNGIINSADIEMSNGKISKITKKEGEGDRVVIPGFIDTHTHGIAGHDFMDGIEATEAISKEFVKFGVTSVYATIVTNGLDVMYKSLKDISNAKSVGANILGIHAEGPFISLEKKGAHNPDHIIPGDPNILQRMYTASNGMLKKVSFAPENCSNDFIDKMTELGIMPTVGHTNASFERTVEAIERGSLNCTHLWNGMSGVANRNPGAAEAIIYDHRIYAELIADLIHVDKETLLFTIKVKGVERIILITDSISAAGLPDGDIELGGTKVVKKDGKVVLKGTDTIAGSAGTMIDCFKNLINLGVPVTDVVKMSSYNSAKSLGLTGKGLIQEGMDADLILMDQNYNIEKVAVGGEFK